MMSTGPLGILIVLLVASPIIIDFSAATISEATLSTYKTVMNILNHSNYSKNIRPSLLDDKSNATTVYVNMLIRFMEDIDDLKMKFSSQISFRQKWLDPRLKYDPESPEELYVTLEDDLIHKIWKPDIFFVNEADSFLHKLMQPNHYIRVFPNGEILWSSRITVIFRCPMEFEFFPFDRQSCTMKFSSYSSTRPNVLIAWDTADEEDPITFMENPKFSRFRLMSYEASTCPVETLITGQYEFGCIYLRFDLRRLTGLYITQVYIPTILFVMLSWISFWLGQFLTARLSLTLTILLTLATQIQGLNLNTPQVAYMRAIDLWAGFCLTIVSLAVLQSAIVACLIQRKRSSNHASRLTDVVPVSNYKMEDSEVTQQVVKMDKISKVVFPLTFIVFSIGYVTTFIIFDNEVLLDSNFGRKSINAIG